MGVLGVTVGPCLRDKDRFGVKDKKVRMVFGFGFSKYMCNTQKEVRQLMLVR